MNYFPFHVGDYAAATAHLTWDEDMAYTRLLRAYYLTEQPIPLDKAYRLARATTPAQRKAVDTVLAEFFVKTDNGYQQTRCDAEIAKFCEAKANHWAKKLSKAERAAIQGERNARKAKATPRWLSKKDMADIAEIYSQAVLLTASTGVKHEVDHIVPLRSKVVCGLHVAWNLRVIPAHANRSKSNSFEVV